MNTDPIADLLTRIRNGHQAGKKEVSIPFSNMKHEIVKILQSEGFLKTYKVEGDSRKDIVVTLKYTEENAPVIHEIKRVSRPGCRVYKGYREIKPILNGLAVGIISTPKGLMTDSQAREQKMGGEILCTIF
jgi:small subunit ribosomal protein S8